MLLLQSFVEAQPIRFFRRLSLGETTLAAMEKERKHFSRDDVETFSSLPFAAQIFADDEEKLKMLE